MWMFVLVLMVIVYVLSCLFLIVVILGQEGKGGGLSGLMGSSALGDTLGASAAESTLRRWTRNAAITFVVLSLTLTVVGSKVFKKSILDEPGGPAAIEQAPPPGDLTTGPLPMSDEDVTVPPEAPISPVTTTDSVAPPVTIPPAAPPTTGPVTAPPSVAPGLAPPPDLPTTPMP
jgi:preprotein translocase subunit SecG